MAIKHKSGGILTDVSGVKHKASGAFADVTPMAAERADVTIAADLHYNGPGAAHYTGEQYNNIGTAIADSIAGRE